MNAFVKYTVARTLLLVVTYAVLWALVHLKWDMIKLIDPFVLLGAIILSAVISLFALRGLRAEVSQKFEARAQRVRAHRELSRDSDEVDKLD